MIFFSSKEKVEEEAKTALVLEWVRTHRISQGKGAELLGMNRWDFYELLAKYSIPTVDITQEELEEGAKNLRQASEKIK